jgi:uncharacterized delta-60 repeat protein
MKHRNADTLCEPYALPITFGQKAIGRVAIACFALLSTAASIAAPADLDSRFGTGGKVIDSLGNRIVASSGAARQADGKIVMTSSCGTSICLARFLPDGTLDDGFGTGGRVMTSVPGLSPFLFSVSIQTDGKLVLGGSCRDTTNNRFSYCVARYTESGLPDLSFASKGIVTTAFGSGNDSGTGGVAMQPDGKIVLAGSCQPVDLASNREFCIVRYTSTGQLDTTFNGTGKVTMSVGAGDVDAAAIALQVDGKIVTAGYCKGPSYVDFCLTRHNTNGSVDTRFASFGKASTDFGFESSIQGLALQADGKIVAVGYCTGTTYKAFCSARYDGSDGDLDTSFAGDGKLLTSIAADDDISYAVAVQTDGKIVVGGGCRNDTSDNFEFCIARYSDDGSADTTFNGNGEIITAMTAKRDKISTLILQSDGKIVAAGECDVGVGGSTNYTFCMARYQGGPFGAQNCSLDIDGDGKVLATTDMLIGTRVALGMTGNAVLGGIAFSANAARDQWGNNTSRDIRKYLITQCGMSLL